MDSATEVRVRMFVEREEGIVVCVQRILERTRQRRVELEEELSRSGSVSPMVERRDSGTKREATGGVKADDSAPAKRPLYPALPNPDAAPLRPHNSRGLRAIRALSTDLEDFEFHAPTRVDHKALAAANSPAKHSPAKPHSNHSSPGNATFTKEPNANAEPAPLPARVREFHVSFFLLRLLPW